MERMTYLGRGEHSPRELELMVEHQQDKIEFLTGKAKSLQNLNDGLLKELRRLLQEMSKVKDE